jgi:hypothetical protein
MIVDTTYSAYYVNAASYNTGTGIWQFGYNPTPLSTGVYCGTLTTTGGVLPTGYGTIDLYFLFFYSGVGGGFGLADSYANALAEVPVIFTTGGTGNLVFKKQGGFYKLQARVPECCDEPYFNGISPTSAGPYIFPNYWAKYATIDFQTFTRSSLPLVAGDNAANPANLLTILNSSWDLMPYTMGGYSPDMLPAYQNQRSIPIGTAGDAASAYCYLKITYDGTNLTYTLNVSYGTAGTSFGSFSGSTNPLWIFSKTVAIAGIDLNNILSGTVVLDTFTDYAGSPSYANVPTVFPSIVFSDNISDFALPATLTLTKTVGTYLYKTSLYSAYPTRGWTTNNYTSELPNSITLNKVAGFNIYEAEFITAVNVINRVRLKLTYFYISSELRGGWGYASYDWFTNTYLPGVTRYMQFPIPSPFAFNSGNPIDGSPFHTWPPAVVQSGTVAIDLFKMAGTPNTAGVQYSYGFANYTMEPTAIPP